MADSTRIPEKKVADSSRIPGKKVAGILLTPLGFRDSETPGFWDSGIPLKKWRFLFRFQAKRWQFPIGNLAANCAYVKTAK